MSALLTDPTAVVTVGGADSVRADVEAAVTDGADLDVRSVDTVEVAVDVLAARDDVGCVVLLGCADEDVGHACDRLRAADDLVPVLVHAADVDDEVLAELARRSDCRYLPRSTPAATLRAAVDDALETYARRRDEAADSEILGILLGMEEISVFAKDDRARYVRSTDLLEGLDDSDVLGSTDREIFGPRYPQTAVETYRDDLAVVETGEPVRRKRERFGTEFWSEATKLPWRTDDGEVRGLVGVAIDVTAAVECEEELEAQRRRFDRFASYVSHDLRTPLQISYGALDRARAGDDSALDKLEEAQDRIAEIIDDLRELAEGDVDDREPGEVLGAIDPVPSTRLPVVFKKIWQVTAPSTATLDVELPEETVITAENEVVRPMIENLLKNAVDHGGPEVRVRVGVTDGRGFFVADDGPGIPETERSQVREQGYTTTDDGTGTGLSIVEETVDRQGWELSIEESRSGGARFEVTDCPVVRPVDAAMGSPVPFSDAADSGDVGDVEAPGHANYDPETDRWTVVGGGEDVWADVNEFHFVSADVDGPVRIEGRIANLDGVDEYSKAGLMIRDDARPDAAFCYVGASESHGTEVIWRSERGGLADSEQFEEPAGTYSWYRLDRVGETVTCSLSSDGEEWKSVDHRPVSATDPVAVGLAVCSRSIGETCEATFADVTVGELDVDRTDDE